jgi:hypothetical protein
VYYLSAEFLMGRTLTNAVRNMGLGGPYAKALEDLGAKMEQVRARSLLLLARLFRSARHGLRRPASVSPPGMLAPSALWVSKAVAACGPGC